MSRKIFGVPEADQTNAVKTQVEAAKPERRVHARPLMGLGDLSSSNAQPVGAFGASLNQLEQRGKRAEEIEKQLAAGQSVVVDAVFAREGGRRAVQDIASAAGVPFIGIWLEAPREILEQRLSSRRGDVSDADVAVLHKQLTYDLGVMTWRRVDASGDIAAVASAAQRHLA